MIILGIDPGTRRIGYGLIEKLAGKNAKLVAAGLLTVRATESQVAAKETALHLEEIIKKFRPDLLVIEKLYFSKNRKTALRVAESRGVLIFIAAKNNLPVKELAPSEVKACVAGYGQADKRSIAKMVKIILNEPDLKIIDDATDALALAIAGSTRSINL